MAIKICHVTSVHKSTDTRIFEKECSSLSRLEEYDVFLIAPGESYEKNGVKIIGMGQSPTDRFKRMFSFSKMVINRAVEVDADVYHLHDPELLQYVRILKRHNKKVIFDSHEDVADSILDKTYIPRFARKLIARVYAAYAAFIMKKCDALITVTPHIVKKLKRINSATYMITNYPLVDEIDMDKNDNHSDDTLIFAGGISPQWSHDVILKAIDEVDGVKYDLYGVADESYLTTLRKLEGWKKTNYHGAVSFSEVQDALKKATISLVLLRPSHNTAENYGTLGNTKLFESMGAGLPIICTDFTLWKSIIDEANCGICVDPYSVEDLKNAINYLLSNPDELKRLGDNGEKAVHDKYNWETQEAVLFELYKRVTN